MMRRKSGKGNVSWILVFSLLVCYRPPASAIAASPLADLIGRPAPSIELVRSDGIHFSLSASLPSAKAVLVSMWGVRCGACLEEMQYLNVLQNRYKAEGLLIIGVNVDGIDAANLKKQMEKMPIQPEYEVLADPGLQVADSYNLDAAPLTYIIDSTGKVVVRHAGFEDGDAVALEKELRKIMGLQAK